VGANGPSPCGAGAAGTNLDNPSAGADPGPGLPPAAGTLGLVSVRPFCSAAGRPLVGVACVCTLILGAVIVIGAAFAASALPAHAHPAAVREASGTPGHPRAHTARTQPQKGARSLTLLGQSPAVVLAQPGGAPFELDLGIGANVPSDAQVAVTVDDRLSNRSTFLEDLVRTPTDTLDALPRIAVDSLSPTSDGGRAFVATVVSSGTATRSAGATPTIDLGCVSGNTCAGVYPLVVALEGPGGGIIAHLTTFLTYAESTSEPKLFFALVLPFQAPIVVDARSLLPGAGVRLSASEITTLADVTTVLRTNPAVPLTLAANPATVQALESVARTVGSAQAQTAQRILVSLAALFAGPATHDQFLPQPYVPIDLSALAGAGVTTEIAAQMNGAAAVMSPIHPSPTTPVLETPPPAPGQPNTGTWIATGPVSSSLARGLPLVHASRVVLPDTDLASTTTQGTWSETFTLSLGTQQVFAAASDTHLAAQFQDDGDPVLAANQVLADLAMIQSEYPSEAGRGLVAVVPSTWQPNPAFLRALLSGLTNNPVVEPVTINNFFGDVVTGKYEAPTRRLATTDAAPAISPSEASAIVRARQRLDAFYAAVGSSPPVVTELYDRLLAAESSDLGPRRQRVALSLFERALNNQLHQIRLATTSVTLTARSGSIPVTITNNSGYTVHAFLTVSGDKFEFPAGSTRSIVLDRPTFSTRISVLARTSGELPLTLTLSSPTTPAGPPLVIARGQISVRWTATSLVGILLTAGSVLVLAVWWARTWLRGRERRARHEAS